MGKITVTGTAQREVCYDAIELRITFQGRSKKLPKPSTWSCGNASSCSV